MIKSSSFFRRHFVGIFMLVGCCTFSSLSATEFNIIPYPQKLTPQSGSFTFNNQTVIFCPFDKPEVLKLAQQFSTQFQLVSGIKIPVRNITRAQKRNAVIFQVSTTLANAEAYELNISSKLIGIKASAANGFFYGLQTLYQLLPAEIYGKTKATDKKWLAPAVEISDAPRFSYRGLHLDVCRHFFPVAFIKKYIDAMAIHKLNTFHWHLTEDQGWRIEIKKYPLLTKIGSQRNETLVGEYYDRLPQLYDGKPYGGFYTQEEAKEVVAYAKTRFITVIPEIELPGHAQAAIASYPFLSCRPDSSIKVATTWGVFDEVYCPRETTFKFLEEVLTEIMDIFPSKYIHIGGDECPKTEWKKSPECQAMIKKLNLKDEDGLQSYFVHRIEQFIDSKGRKIIGWDEILDGGLDPNATVMSWRGTQGGITAAKAGNDVIMTPGAFCYFDQYQSDPVGEPLSIGGFLPLQKVYQFEPIPTEISAEEAKHVLGGQANVWTEYIPTTESVEYMVFPRLAAMAEALWSSKENRNWESFRKRLPSEFDRYEQLGIKASKAFYDVQFNSKITPENKLQITLLCDCPNAQIHYSINGKDNLYKDSFKLPASADISARALVDGRQTGKTITKSFLVSKLTGLPYTQSMKSLWYTGGTTYALTDGVTGNDVDYSQWVGFGKGKDVEVMVDMQSVQRIERFALGMLNAPAKCAQISPDIKLYGSTDGINYQLLSEKQQIAPTEPTRVIVRTELTFPATDVRYLKLQLKNPNYCPANKLEGTECGAMFLDEIGAW
ncbi:MAG: family 20 glycosylhydrolase [Paludibacter sp.]|nr:family 20 glycosylhydrolase [Paludibacter sp.]